VLIAGLLVASLAAWPETGGVAAAATPPPPAGCPFTLSLPTEFQGAAGSLIIHLTFHPVSHVEACTITVGASLDIVPSSGGIYREITDNPDRTNVAITFMPGRQDPTITFLWAAYCASPEVPATFVGKAGGQTVTAAYGAVFSCESKGFAGSELSSSYQPDLDSVGISPSADGGGYDVAQANGNVAGAGDVPRFASVTSNAPIVGIAASPTGQGRWLVGADGGVFTLFGTPFYGSAADLHLNAPVVGMAPTHDGGGYWLVAADGGIFSYGDAHFFGSAAGLHLNAPVVGMAPTADGGGYWLVARDGGVFAYGDARFEGSAGAIQLNQPMVGMAASPSPNGGYWLVGADGGVFSYGATFFGSAATLPLSAPISAIAAGPDGGGYWLLSADGGVHGYGDAPVQGA
jgi:hypothetical protein